jgi:tagatose-1,6-bisphosphate aldolase non-catalytic subunit AgaZ/GatZ
MSKVSSIGNSLAYLLCQTRQDTTDYTGMTPEDFRVVSNRMPDIRDIGTIPVAHTMAALPHERPVTNLLAYLLCQTRQDATDYTGMTPEDFRAVFEKSLRGEREKRAATRNDTRKERAVRLSPHASGRTGSELTDLVA